MHSCYCTFPMSKVICTCLSLQRLVATTWAQVNMNRLVSLLVAKGWQTAEQTCWVSVVVCFGHGAALLYMHCWNSQNTFLKSVNNIDAYNLAITISSAKYTAIIFTNANKAWLQSVIHWSVWHLAWHASAVYTKGLSHKLPWSRVVPSVCYSPVTHIECVHFFITHISMPY